MPFYRSGFRRSTGYRRRSYGGYKKRTYKPTYRKKPRYSSRRKNTRVVPRVYIHRPIANMGIPKTLNTKLSYCSSFTLTCAASSAMSQYRFRLNSIYDPDLTGTGTQPYMRDQIMPLYQYYLVYGCKINIQCTPVAVSGSLIQLFFTIDGDGNPPPTTADYIQELPYVAQRQIVNSKSAYYRRYVDVAKTTCIQKTALLTESDYKTTANNNPSLLNPCLTISWRSLDASTPIFLFNIRMVYYTQFSCLVTQAQS